MIEQVIDSVNHQTYSPVEIIIVDDCSTDNSINVIQSLQVNQNNIKLIALETNCGANACRNIGVEHAGGDYIAFLDSDDFFLPTKLEKQMRILQNQKDIGFVVTGFGAKGIHNLPEGTIPIQGTLKQNNLGGFSTLMVRKSLFLKVGGLDQELLSCQDWDLFLKLLQISKGYKIEEDLVIYEVQTDSISKNATKVIQGYTIVTERATEINEKLQLIPPKELKAFQEYYLAMRHFKLENIKQTRKHLHQSILISPKPIPILYWTVSLLGYSAFKTFLKTKYLFNLR
ncbi:glycosyltransferase family 2 protein [Streptococcus suis]|nr:glycosyltransferase family 2 protein [Streptococcus suis]